MHLLKNVNQHSAAGRYSALWGYVAPNGREYAILGCYDGTAFIDITDSANIREVDFVPNTGTGSSNAWREMKFVGHYAYVVSELSQSGIQIMDLQYLPDSVRYVGKFNMTSHSSTHSISTDGTYLYLNGVNTSFVPTGGIAIVSLANPEVPVKIGQWATKYVHDCRIINDTIYASCINAGEINIINATNKAAPVTVKTFQTVPNPFTHNSARTVDGKYLFTTDETSSPNGKLKVWNIANLNNVTYVRNWLPTSISTAIVHNVEIYGNLAVIAHYTAGIRVLNIADPENPVEIGWYDTYPSSNSASFNGCWGVYMFPSGKIVGSDMQTGLYVVKVTSLTNAGSTGVTVPEKYSLSQNYPNPFNPTTKINFSLPKSSNVSLKIHNMAGKEVASVVNDRRDAGNYEVTFDAANYGLSSGTYFYTLTTNGFTETKKMMLIK
ncbi:MAG TPA: choice-of-anchor B family protein [Ignavibacteria bacterium]|nr:choice-of-anchor B family protein [Ignavibacteria bacterium]